MSRSGDDPLSHVHLTPSLRSFQRGQVNVKGPTLDCRQTNLLAKWLDQGSANQSRQSVCSSSQHLCERDLVLAQHDKELFEPAQAASHICDGSVYDDERRSKLLSCAVCKLISQLPAYKANNKYGLYVINILNDNEQHMALNYPPEFFMMGLAVSEEDSQRESRGRLGYLPPSMEGIRREDLLVPTYIGHTGDTVPRHASPYHARALDPDRADFPSAKAWIQECSTLHPSCSATTTGLSGIIHVIDCVSGSILPLPVDTEYLALSYVWGPPPETGSLKQAFRKFEVLKNVPRTIADAMAVTLLLDYQYLWCDRYCIDQDDPVTKALQLSLMDRIYEAAKVTLVAGSGVDDSYGLPGSGTLPLVSRDTQSQAWIGSHRVIPVGPDIPTTVRQSKWATRAWTFQEAKLSTRCLIFGPRQLQFLCRTTSRYEVLPCLPRLSSYDQGGEINIDSVFRASDADRDDNTSMTTLESFQFLASELLRRDITYESDTLNAFRGILNRLEYFSFFGVPLITREGRNLCKSGASGPQESSSGGISGIPNAQIATLLDSKRIIASSTLDPSKKRHQPNLFHSGTWQHYMYDQFPGPGEPMQPSPTLAFLHGLTWIRDEDEGKDFEGGNLTRFEVKRRSDMPSWSWVSLQKSPVKYRNDYSWPKEIAGDVLLNLYSGIQLWVQQKSDSPQLEWIPMDEAWAQTTSKVLPEFGHHVKLETLTGYIESCIVNMPEFDNNKYKFSVTVRDLAAAKKNEFKLDLDCAAEDLPVSGAGSYHNLGWKFALLLSTTFYNPDHEIWQDLDPQRVFVVLRPFQGVWKRVGIICTDPYYGSEDDVLISTLKPEAMILC